MKSEKEIFRQGIVYLQNAGRHLPGLLYPPRCPFCEEILSGAEEKNNLACDSCRQKIVYVTEDYCLRCGRPLVSEKEEYCRDCERRKHMFTQGRSVFTYSSPVKQSLYRMKNNNRQEYAGFYAQEIKRLLGPWIRGLEINVIIPVPMYPKKKRIRGYNQAEILAVRLGKCMDIPVDSHVLVKRENTQAQKKLNAEERRKNLKNAFEAKYLFEGEHILLIDDIYTTGATADMAANALLKAGAGKVFVVTAAIGNMA